MIEQREPVATVGFINEYCQAYRHLFEDVRSFEQFKFLHVGLLSGLARKTLPAIAQLVGLQNAQSLHHFLRGGVWSVEQLRAVRLSLIAHTVGERRIGLCLDETGDVKKGQATDYVAKQYIGNIGRLSNGIVSVNA
ncbi:transposase [Cyanobacteria bacterium FACHB-502]|nr:transposase [Cyanobacteria bacterium FACHB-502]